MSKTNDYRTHLRALAKSEWESYLLQESGLPGPGGNLTKSRLTRMDAVWVAEAKKSINAI